MPGADVLIAVDVGTSGARASGFDVAGAPLDEVRRSYPTYLPAEGWAEQSQGDGVREMFVQAGKLAIDIGTAGQIRRSKMDELAAWLSLATLSLTALTSLFALVKGASRRVRRRSQLPAPVAHP